MLLEFIDTTLSAGTAQIISSHHIADNSIPWLCTNCEIYDNNEALDSYFYGEFRDNECNAILK